MHFVILHYFEDCFCRVGGDGLGDGFGLFDVHLGGFFVNWSKIRAS